MKNPLNLMVVNIFVVKGSQGEQKGEKASENFQVQIM